MIIDQSAILRYDSVFLPASGNRHEIVQDLAGQQWISNSEKLALKYFKKICCCITIYNEPGNALLYSLTGLIHNIDYLIKQENGSLAINLTVCIIFDGLEKASESAIHLTQTLNLYHPEKKVSEADFHIFDTHLDRTRLKREIIDSSLNQSLDISWKDIYQAALKNKSWEVEDKSDSLPCRVLLCFKAKNTGKLDSHWWFFKFFCPHLQPDYCIQMDVGTVPQEDCTAHLLSFMERYPAMGAVGGNTLATKPPHPWQVILTWQFGYFCTEKFLRWPAEIFSGYLTIIPGQFSMIRWSSLTAQRGTNCSKQLSILGGSTPLDTYLRGLGDLTFLEKTMFLAEDRILGFEIMTHSSHSCKLSFVPEAIVFIDSCHSLRELLGQRRRWTNSAIASRIWIYLQILPILRINSISPENKISLLTSLFLQFGDLVFAWFFLSFYSCWLTDYYLNSKAVFSNCLWLSSLYNLSFVLGIILLAFMFLTCLQNKLEKQYENFLIIVIGYHVSLLIVHNLTLIVTDKIAGLSSPYLLVLTLVSAFIPLLYPSKISKNYKNLNLLLFFWIDPIFNLLINVYSLLNFQDCSWGTKDLTSESQSLQKNGIFRISFIFFWLLSNMWPVLILLLYHSFSPVRVIIFWAYLWYLFFLITGGIVGLSRIVRQGFATSQKC